MKRIPLTQGKEALLDDVDYEYLMHWKWCVSAQGYAVRGCWIRGSGGKQRLALMHRVVAERMGLDGSLQVDHRNMDRLDNRRCNLRAATITQQRANRNKCVTNRAGFKGVTKVRNRAKCWAARIACAKERHHLGYFYTREEAALAYNEAALRLFGSFARLNEVA